MKILAIQNRMGIGDMVIFLPFIEAISKKFNSPVSILVKESSKALEFSLTKILTGELNFFDIASINGKKITISPIPILFCIANIFI